MNHKQKKIEYLLNLHKVHHVTSAALNNLLLSNQTPHVLFHIVLIELYCIGQLCESIIFSGSFCNKASSFSLIHSPAALIKVISNRCSCIWIKTDRHQKSPFSPSQKVVCVCVDVCVFSA